MSDNYFTELAKIKLETDLRGNFTYASWSEAWDAVKRFDPDASFEWHENENGTLGLLSAIGGYGKVTVTIKGRSHTAYLPIMDHRNKPIPFAGIDPFHINKTYQRAFVKAIAMHGLGLYVYKGEDYPDKETDVARPTAELSPGEQVMANFNGIGITDVEAITNLLMTFLGRKPSVKEPVTEADLELLNGRLKSCSDYCITESVADFLLFVASTNGAKIESATAVEGAFTAFQNSLTKAA